MAQVNEYSQLGRLPEGDVSRLRAAVESYGSKIPAWMSNRPKDVYTGESKHLFGADVAMAKDDDVNMMRKIRCYKGIRHETGQKVRGQRTKSSGRTGSTVGVSKKKVTQGGGA
jgi:small subunit ribosomal protein S13